MTERQRISPERRDEMFAALRRNILVARLKVSLDEELNRPSSPLQKRLAGMKLPPPRSRHSYVSTGPNGSRTQQPNMSSQAPDWTAGPENLTEGDPVMTPGEVSLPEVVTSTDTDVVFGDQGRHA